jgi:ABC-type bacteriocin/lantibiotic exporter with double-glycine peptidase domain
MDAGVAVLVGLIIGIFYSWQMVLVSLALSPFIMMTGFMIAKFQQGLSVSDANANKNANLLAGDAILNYKTVSSFA